MANQWQIDQSIARGMVLRLAASPAALLLHALLAMQALLKAEHWALRCLLAALLVLQIYFALRVCFDLLIFRWFAQAHTEQEWHRRLERFDRTLAEAAFRLRCWFVPQQTKQVQNAVLRSMMERRHGAMILFYKQLGCLLIQLLWAAGLSLL